MKFINSFRLWARLSVLTFLVLGSACATKDTYVLYPGPVKPQEETAKIALPWSLDILTVDGKSVGRKAFESQEPKLIVLPGLHALEVRYSNIWDLSAEDHEKIQSQPVLLYLEAQAGHSYMLKHPPLDNVDAARTYAAQPKIWIVDAKTGDEVQAPLPGVTQHMPPGGSTAATPEAYATAITDAIAKAVSPDAQRTATEDSTTLKLLKFWWNQASAEERSAFAGWITKQ